MGKRYHLPVYGPTWPGLGTDNSWSAHDANDSAVNFPSCLFLSLSHHKTPCFSIAWHRVQKGEYQKSFVNNLGAKQTRNLVAKPRYLQTGKCQFLPSLQLITTRDSMFWKLMGPPPAITCNPLGNGLLVLSPAAPEVTRATRFNRPI